MNMGPRICRPRYTQQQALTCGFAVSFPHSMGETLPLTGASRSFLVILYHHGITNMGYLVHRRKLKAINQFSLPPLLIVRPIRQASFLVFSSHRLFPSQRTFSTSVQTTLCGSCSCCVCQQHSQSTKPDSPQADTPSPPTSKS